MIRLIGSKTEDECRDELMRLNEVLQKPEFGLKKALEAAGHETKHACVLQCIPEQGEYFHTILIDRSYLIEIEIDKYDSLQLPLLDKIELKSYQHGLSKINQIRLAVAMDLVNKKHN